MSVKERDAVQLSVFPNPFNDETTITFSNPNKERAHIQITDTKGKLKVREYLNVNSNKVTIKKLELAKGLYYVQLRKTKQSIA